MYVGRLVEYKRVDDLLGAIKIIKGHIPDIQCKVIEAGRRRTNSKRLQKSLGSPIALNFLDLFRLERRYRADETLACFLSAVRS